MERSLPLELEATPSGDCCQPSLGLGLPRDLNRIRHFAESPLSPISVHFKFPEGVIEFGRWMCESSKTKGFTLFRGKTNMPGLY